MRLSHKALEQHVYVLGGTGVGKSRALETWIMQLIKAGQGIGVLDPHGELFHNVLARIAGLSDSRLLEKVIVVNPLDPNFVVGFNPLEIRAGEILQRKARFLADVVTKIWRADPLITARMQRMMLQSFWLLAQAGLTLIELPFVLVDQVFRDSLLASAPGDSPLHQYWEHEFPTDARLVTEWTQSTLNKAGSLVVDPDLRLLFGQQHSTIDYRRIMDEGLILLVNLSKGELISETSHMLGAFVMAQIQQAALSRARDPAASHRRFTLFVDEFQNYTTDNIQEILAESRKYKLSLVMAHQFYQQLRINPVLQAAVINTVGNLVIFRIGHADAQIFVRDMFHPHVDQVKDVRVRYQKVPTIFGEVNQRFEDVVYRNINEIWETEVRKLTQLKKREFWYKKRGPTPARKFRSFDLPDVKMTGRLRANICELVDLSNQRWARSKSIVQAEIAARHHRLFNTNGRNDTDDGLFEPPPIWGE